MIRKTLAAILISLFIAGAASAQQASYVFGQGSIAERDDVYRPANLTTDDVGLVWIQDDASPPVYWVYTGAQWLNLTQDDVTATPNFLGEWVLADNLIPADPLGAANVPPSQVGGQDITLGQYYVIKGDGRLQTGVAGAGAIVKDGDLLFAGASPPLGAGQWISHLGELPFSWSRTSTVLNLLVPGKDSVQLLQAVPPGIALPENPTNFAGGAGLMTAADDAKLQKQPNDVPSVAEASDATNTTKYLWRPSDIANSIEANESQADWTAIAPSNAEILNKPASATQVEMQTGTEPAVRQVSPLRVREAIDAAIADRVTWGEAADQTARLALTGLKPGDVIEQLDTGVGFRLETLPATNPVNWTVTDIPVRFANYVDINGLLRRGLSVSHEGTGMALQRAAGTLIEFNPAAGTFDQFDFPAENPLTFDIIDSTGSVVTAGATALDISQWDNGGAVTPVNQADDATVQRVYKCTDGRDFVQLGQEQYNTVGQARQTWESELLQTPAVLAGCALTDIIIARRSMATAAPANNFMYIEATRHGEVGNASQGEITQLSGLVVADATERDALTDLTGLASGTLVGVSTPAEVWYVEQAAATWAVATKVQIYPDAPPAYQRITADGQNLAPGGRYLFNAPDDPAVTSTTLADGTFDGQITEIWNNASLVSPNALYISGKLYVPATDTIITTAALPQDKQFEVTWNASRGAWLYEDPGRGPEVLTEANTGEVLAGASRYLVNASAAVELTLPPVIAWTVNVWSAPTNVGPVTFKLGDASHKFVFEDGSEINADYVMPPTAGRVEFVADVATGTRWIIHETGKGSIPPFIDFPNGDADISALAADAYPANTQARDGTTGRVRVLQAQPANDPTNWINDPLGRRMYADETARLAKTPFTPDDGEVVGIVNTNQQWQYFDPDQWTLLNPENPDFTVTTLAQLGATTVDEVFRLDNGNLVSLGLVDATHITAGADRAAAPTGNPLGPIQGGPGGTINFANASWQFQTYDYDQVYRDRRFVITATGNVNSGGMVGGPATGGVAVRLELAQFDWPGRASMSLGEAGSSSVSRMEIYAEEIPKVIDIAGNSPTAGSYVELAPALLGALGINIAQNVWLVVDNSTADGDGWELAPSDAISWDDLTDKPTLPQPANETPWDNTALGLEPPPVTVQAAIDLLHQSPVAQPDNTELPYYIDNISVDAATYTFPAVPVTDRIVNLSLLPGHSVTLPVPFGATTNAENERQYLAFAHNGTDWEKYASGAAVAAGWQAINAAYTAECGDQLHAFDGPIGLPDDAAAGCTVTVTDPQNDWATTNLVLNVGASPPGQTISAGQGGAGVAAFVLDVDSFGHEVIAQFDGGTNWIVSRRAFDSPDPRPPLSVLTLTGDLTVDSTVAKTLRIDPGGADRALTVSEALDVVVKVQPGQPNSISIVGTTPLRVLAPGEIATIARDSAANVEAF